MGDLQRDVIRSWKIYAPMIILEAVRRTRHRGRRRKLNYSQGAIAAVQVGRWCWLGPGCWWRGQRGWTHCRSSVDVGLSTAVSGNRGVLSWVPSCPGILWLLPGALAVKGELLLRKSWHKSSAELCLCHAVVITGPWVWGENFCKPITIWQQSTPQARFCLTYRHLLVNKCKNGHTTSSVKLNGAPASYRLVIQKHLAWKVHLDGDVAISHCRIPVT